MISEYNMPNFDILYAFLSLWNKNFDMKTIFKK